MRNASASTLLTRQCHLGCCRCSVHRCSACQGWLWRVMASLTWQLDQPGRVVLLGTPAEETDGGKIKLLNAGAYKSMDVRASAACDAADRPGLRHGPSVPVRRPRAHARDGAYRRRVLRTRRARGRRALAGHQRARSTCSCTTEQLGPRRCRSVVLECQRSAPAAQARCARTWNHQGHRALGRQHHPRLQRALFHRPLAQGRGPPGRQGARHRLVCRSHRTAKLTAQLQGRRRGDWLQSEDL